MIKMIFLDIDGTLINDQGIITPRTLDALLAVQERGVRVAIASGREERGLYQWADPLKLKEHHGILLTCNGARVLDAQTGEVLFARQIPVAEAKKVLRHLKQFDVVPMIAHGVYMHTTDVYGGMIDYRGEKFDIVRFEARSNRYLLCEHEDLEAWVTEPIEKILTAAAPAYLVAHAEEMGAPFRDTLSAMFTADFYYEYMPKGVEKGTAIEAVLPKLGLHREEIMAFGDAENDRSMIEFAGIGVATGNAMDSVKAAADWVSADCNHDGVAEALAHFGLI
ncbi:MAG: HAD family phosphatase [Lachnospiraceae bacterium]|nr:HAD family phosphatase [Lachnospiraceae bacterium]